MLFGCAILPLRQVSKKPMTQFAKRSPAVLLALTVLATAAGLPLASDRVPEPPALSAIPKECLVLPPVGRHGRSPLASDALEAQIVAGKWKPPVTGDAVVLPDG